MTTYQEATNVKQYEMAQPVVLGSRLKEEKRRHIELEVKSEKQFQNSFFIAAA